MSGPYGDVQQGIREVDVGLFQCPDGMHAGQHSIDVTIYGLRCKAHRVCAMWGGHGGGWWHMATWTMGAGGMQAGSLGRVWAYLLVVKQDAVEQPVHPVIDTCIRIISAKHRSESLHN